MLLALQVEHGGGERILSRQLFSILDMVTRQATAIGELWYELFSVDVDWTLLQQTLDTCSLAFPACAFYILHSSSAVLKQLALRNDAKVEENKKREPQLPQLVTKEYKRAKAHGGCKDVM